MTDFLYIIKLTQFRLSLEYNDFKILRFAYPYLSVYLCINNKIIQTEMTALEFNNSLIGMKSNLQKFAMSLTSDRDSALDLVQDTYLKAITYKDKFVDYTNLKAWVFTIMKNTFINNYRRGIRENTMVDGTQDLYYINMPHDKGFISPESVYSENEIEKAIDSLEDEFRIPFRMHIEGYKYKEISDELNLKIGTVKSRIFFTRQKLMKILKDYNN
jgi:RNA polymerase sigma factor (sigma-70 family)